MTVTFRDGLKAMYLTFAQMNREFLPNENYGKHCAYNKESTIVVQHALYSKKDLYFSAQCIALKINALTAQGKDKGSI
jgi:hypothetical protein